MSQDKRMRILEAENRQLRQQVELAQVQNGLLLERIQELEARLAKDSHNSNKPPGSHGLARKTRSLRKRSGKKPGGQIGNRGETLRLVAVPDAVVEHRPVVCVGCQEALRKDAPMVARERRKAQARLRGPSRQSAFFGAPMPPVYRRCSSRCRSQ
jgi:transposase